MKYDTRPLLFIRQKRYPSSRCDLNVSSKLVQNKSYCCFSPTCRDLEAKFSDLVGVWWLAPIPPRASFCRDIAMIVQNQSKTISTYPPPPPHTHTHTHTLLRLAHWFAKFVYFFSRRVNVAIQTPPPFEPSLPLLYNPASALESCPPTSNLMSLFHQNWFGTKLAISRQRVGIRQRGLSSPPRVSTSARRMYTR